MVQEIVFHLGDCKTGTTSVQAVLAKQAWRTAAGQGADIVYPARVNHIPLAKSLWVDTEMPFEAERFATVRRAFESSDAAHGVISAEYFEFVDPERVAAAIERHLKGYAGRIRLVAYVRPHADRLVSAFAERTKQGLFMKPLAAMHDKLAAEGLLFYAPRFEKWRRHFGEAFTLRPFIRSSLYKGDVVHDFFSWMTRGEAFQITRPTDQNESLSVEDIAMLRAIHGRIRAETGRSLRPVQQALGWYLADILSSVPRRNGTRPRLHSALARRVVATYAEDAAALDAAFFEGTPMSDALAGAAQKALPEAQSFRAENHFGPEELRLFDIWADLLSRLMTADPEHFKWAVRSPDHRGPTPPTRAVG
ncbi:hypothetical protein [Seohaeicola zhoushanensis]|uniref:Sulfotransferase domain-containing protein n=1 Tax=Seohaeicola zhoushanensis TaxID=1569283 RepID=A0A8J3H283_9RHOB|nr:hypothetical protein [Seohaeicola zhoushanensis]GHF74759.1 hypothetical protein GCM10017056_51690 [Seohaeicola zhoushanensis]